MRLLAAFTTLLCSAIVVSAHGARADQAPASATKRGDITYLQTKSGRTLYTYGKDKPYAGKSDCDKQCAEVWPPFIATKGGKAGGDWVIISRDDGQPQWAYKGRPLYMFFKDTHPGEMKGQNYEGHAWQVASP